MSHPDLPVIYKCAATWRAGEASCCPYPAFSWALDQLLRTLVSDGLWAGTAAAGMRTQAWLWTPPVQNHAQQIKLDPVILKPETT